jgi:hypothetical protein
MVFAIAVWRGLTYGPSGSKALLCHWLPLLVPDDGLGLEGDGDAK